MAAITVKTATGKDAGSIELADALFGVQPNVPLMHQVVTAQLAARRSGTQSTKTRAEVRGGGRKPFKQKGTGNARQGSIRAPHYSGGGVALAPKPRKYDQKTPKKMIKAALASALSDRAAEGKVLVIDEWGFSEPKTKAAIAALGALDIVGTKALVVVEPSDTNPIKSFHNLPEIQLIERSELNAYDVLCNDVVVFTKATLPGLSGEDEVEAKPAQAAPAKQTLLAADEPQDETTEDAPSGSAPANEDGSAPEGFEIKGNADSMLYHVPGSRFYEQTVAEFWFATAEDAEAAGYQLPPSQRDDESEEEQS